jgi:hypothetical protein
MMIAAHHDLRVRVRVNVTPIIRVTVPGSESRSEQRTLTPGGESDATTVAVP